MKKIFILFLLMLSANATAVEYSENVPNACGVNFPHYLQAIITLSQYTCQSGYFLPAYTEGCRACPSGYTCNGGTFTFNETEAQGLTKTENIHTQNEPNLCAVNIPHHLRAIFEPNQHTCNPGYYMPANTDGCVICPADSYCSGGTYTFNETTAQGITACATGLYAPTGMWESAQCGRILHIGDEVVYLRTTKKTLHALHIDVDQDGIADYFGNVTTADVPMHAGTTRKLKLQFNGQVYSIYDDTVNVDE